MASRGATLVVKLGSACYVCCLRQVCMRAREFGDGEMVRRSVGPRRVAIPASPPDPQPLMCVPLEHLQGLVSRDRCHLHGV